MNSNYPSLKIRSKSFLEVDELQKLRDDLNESHGNNLITLEQWHDLCDIITGRIKFLVLEARYHFSRLHYHVSQN